MAHKLPRLEKKKIFNIPHLITPNSFESVMDYILSRPDGMMTKEELAVARDIKKQNKTSLGETSIAVIGVSGVLTYEETWLTALCMMSSYQGIVSKMEQAVEEGYSTVVLDVDSGGGEAYGAFETAKQLRKMANDNNIRLIAYVDGISASAAYCLSAAADEIIVNPYAEVGSIGVLTKLVNDSEKQKKEGISTTYIYAGDNKIPFDAEGEWREDFLADLQGKVDKLYTSFTENVADMRGIPVQAVVDTQAKMFNADEAISLKLADKVMERSEFADYLADLNEGKEMPITSLFSKEKNEETMSNTTPEAVAPVTATLSEADAAMIADLQNKLATLEAHNEQLKASAVEEAKAKLAAQLADFSFVNDAPSLAEALYAMDAEDSNVVLKTLAAAQEAVEASIAEPMAIEGEEEPEEEKDDIAKAKASLEEKIKTKYAAVVK